MKFYTKYDPQLDPGWSSDKPTMTQQRFKDDCDINRLIQKYRVPGGLASDPAAIAQFLAVSDPAAIAASRQGFYGDVSHVPELSESLKLQNQGYALFAKLPAEVKEKFGFNPELFVEFAQRSPDVLVKMFPGLAKEKSVQDTLDVTGRTDTATPVSSDDKNTLNEVKK